MAKKNHIRSIRFSDELADLIDRQAGDSFSAKFEALITRCVWELPEKERRLEHIEKDIQDKRRELRILSQRAEAYGRALREMQYQVEQLSRSITRAEQIEDNTN